MLISLKSTLEMYTVYSCTLAQLFTSGQSDSFNQGAHGSTSYHVCESVNFTFEQVNLCFED